MLTVSACAKINLTLEVLHRREDGFHEIRSVLQTISLADEIDFEPAPTVTFVCDDERADRVDLLEKPVMQAVSLLRRGMDHCAGARICLRKLQVPRAAGLGASASLPAAILKGLNSLWHLNLPQDHLARLAAMMGSDTAFFIRSGTALAEGRGERVTPLPTPEPTWLVLLNPAISPMTDKTRRMYGLLNSSHFSDGATTERMIEHLRRGDSLHSGTLRNIFEDVAFDAVGHLDEYRQRFLDAGAQSVHLAGAGPALFTLVSDHSSGESLQQRLAEDGLETFLAHTV